MSDQAAFSLRTALNLDFACGARPVTSHLSAKMYTAAWLYSSSIHRLSSEVSASSTVAPSDVSFPELSSPSVTDGTRLEEDGSKDSGEGLPALGDGLVTS